MYKIHARYELWPDGRVGAVLSVGAVDWTGDPYVLGDVGDRCADLIVGPYRSWAEVEAEIERQLGLARKRIKRRRARYRFPDARQGVVIKEEE